MVPQVSAHAQRLSLKQHQKLEHYRTTTAIRIFGSGKSPAQDAAGRVARTRLSAWTAGLVRTPHALHRHRPARTPGARRAAGCRAGGLFLQRPAPDSGTGQGALLSLFLPQGCEVCAERCCQRNPAHRGAGTPGTHYRRRQHRGRPLRHRVVPGGPQPTRGVEETTRGQGYPPGRGR